MTPARTPENTVKARSTSPRSAQAPAAATSRFSPSSLLTSSAPTSLPPAPVSVPATSALLRKGSPTCCPRHEAESPSIVTAPRVPSPTAAQGSGTDGQAACLTASQPGKPAGRSLPETCSARPCEASADCAEMPHRRPQATGPTVLLTCSRDDQDAERENANQWMTP